MHGDFSAGAHIRCVQKKFNMTLDPHMKSFSQVAAAALIALLSCCEPDVEEEATCLMICSCNCPVLKFVEACYNLLLLRLQSSLADAHCFFKQLHCTNLSAQAVQPVPQLLQQSGRPLDKKHQKLRIMR